jgi:hypothetical protein
LRILFPSFNEAVRRLRFIKWKVKLDLFLSKHHAFKKYLMFN